MLNRINAVVIIAVLGYIAKCVDPRRVHKELFLLPLSVYS